MTTDSPTADSWNCAVVVCALSAFPSNVKKVPKDDRSQNDLAHFGQQWVNLNPSQRSLVEMAVTTPASDGLMTQADSDAIIAAYMTAAQNAGRGGEIISATGHGAVAKTTNEYSWADFGAQLGPYQDHTSRITSAPNSALMQTTLDAVRALLADQPIKCVNFYNCSIAKDNPFCEKIRDSLGTDICASELYTKTRWIKKKGVLTYQIATTATLNGLPKEKDWSSTQWAGGLQWFRINPNAP